MNKRLPIWLLALIAVLCLVLPWQPIRVLPLIFVAFVPILFIEERIRQSYPSSSRLRFFAICFGIVFTWNLGSVWWIKNASLEGAILAFIVDALVMSLPLFLYHIRCLQYPGISQRNSFVLFWLGAEYLHSHWQLSFPWLILGNVFSYAPSIVQWYEITGVMGGSIWVLWVNFALFTLIKKYSEHGLIAIRSQLFSFLFWLFFTPLFASFYLYPNTSNDKQVTSEVVVVQPNLDPYTEKFGAISPEEQTRRMLQLADSVCTPKTLVVVLPETALVGGIDEQNNTNDERLRLLKNFIQQHPGTAILSGADSYKTYDVPASSRPTLTARLYEGQTWYDSYNSAVFVSGNNAPEWYHKSKLVPGVEKIPYPEIFGFLERMAIQLGGTSGSLGSDADSRLFTCANRTRLAPVICFESVFSDYVSSYVSKGAHIICIVTNDGWWGNTPGYQQHFDFARLRAIENRRWIARSANTGISGFINEKGEIVQRSEWWKPGVYKQNIPVLTEETWFTQYASTWNTILLFLVIYELIRTFRRR